MGARISIDYVSHTFHKSKKQLQEPTLKEIDLTIEQGQAISLVGESGCGKSTLLHILAGLLKPTVGCVRINGKTVSGPCSSWNMMFQKPALFPWLNVKQNIRLGLEFTGNTAGADEKIAELLELVGLADKADSRVQDLSGGQQQRIALARSLAVDPDLILLDEPFSALDAFTRRALQNEVIDIVKQRGITLVLVTHDIDEAIMMGDRVVVMGRNPGTIRDDITVDLAYPRNPIHPAFANLREQLMATFEASVDHGKEETSSNKNINISTNVKEASHAKTH